MADVIRLCCPECSHSKEIRKEKLAEIIADWVYDEDLRDLLECFGVKISREGTFREYIENLWKEIQKWDFRKGKERWEILADDQRVQDCLPMIDLVAHKLGLLDITDSLIKDPDYILALGGARMTNYNGPLKARSMIDENDWTGVTVAGLSSFRPAAERDIPHFEKYAPGAETEFHAMCGGLEKVFGVSGFKRFKTGNENSLMRSEKRVYDQKYRGGQIAALAAPPSSPEKKRADTLDTFRFFWDEFNKSDEFEQLGQFDKSDKSDHFSDHFNVSEGSKIIFTTNSIYVPFQMMRLMDIALDKNIMIDCVGVKAKPRVPKGKHLLYLQEIKATVDAMHMII